MVINHSKKTNKKAHYSGSKCTMVEATNAEANDKLHLKIFHLAHAWKF
jgi:hypothetical protein